MYTVLVDNHKGGVGKSTTTAHLAWALGSLGRRVVCIDWDPQGSLTDIMHYPVETLNGSPVYDLMMNSKARIMDHLWRYTGFKMKGSVNLIPNSIEMYGYDMKVINNAIITGMDIDFMELKDKILDRLRTFGADICLIDGEPGCDLRTMMAVACSDYIVVPATPDFASSRGLNNTLQVLFTVMEEWVKAEKVVGILPVMVPGALPRHVRRWIQGMMEIADKWHVAVFQNYIPESVRFKDALEVGKPVWEVDKRAPGAFAYIEAAKEMEKAIRRLQNAGTTA